MIPVVSWTKWGIRVTWKQNSRASGFIVSLGLGVTSGFVKAIVTLSFSLSLSLSLSLSPKSNYKTTLFSKEKQISTIFIQYRFCKLIYWRATCRHPPLRKWTWVMLEVKHSNFWLRIATPNLRNKHDFKMSAVTRNALTQASKKGRKPYLFPQKNFVSVFMQLTYLTPPIIPNWKILIVRRENAFCKFHIFFGFLYHNKENKMYWCMYLHTEINPNLNSIYEFFKITWKVSILLY